MIPERMFQVSYLVRTKDGLHECQERLTVKPEKYSEEFSFSKLRNLFLKKHESLARELFVTAVNELDAEGSLLRTFV